MFFIFFYLFLFSFGFDCVSPFFFLPFFNGLLHVHVCIIFIRYKFKFGCDCCRGAVADEVGCCRRRLWWYWGSFRNVFYANARARTRTHMPVDSLLILLNDNIKLYRCSSNHYYYYYYYLSFPSFKFVPGTGRTWIRWKIIR